MLKSPTASLALILISTIPLRHPSVIQCYRIHKFGQPTDGLVLLGKQVGNVNPSTDQTEELPPNLNPAVSPSQETLMHLRGLVQLLHFWVLCFSTCYY
ncbi:hypothetical protein GGI35DRAFT_452932 [Trichoderma velutinum]